MSPSSGWPAPEGSEAASTSVTGTARRTASLRGFSLMEVVLAASLLSLVFLFMLDIFPASLLGVHKGEHRLDASAQAEDILDACRASPFASLQPGSYTVGSPGGWPMARETLADGTVLTPALAISTVPGFDPKRLLQLTVTVRWNQRRVAEHYTQVLQVANLKR